MKGFAPKKKYSQNFLTDPRIADNIVGALDIASGDSILEIGPGTGVLTSRMAASAAAHLVAADVDPRAVEHIRQQPWARRAHGTMDVRLQDALRIQVAEEFPGVPADVIKVIGNIPYGITSDILFWLFGQHTAMHSAVIMMQREVAQRCVATPRTKEYGNLAVATSLVSDARILFHVKPGSFFPKPDVTSSVVRFVFRNELRAGTSFEGLMTFVRQAFSQRRKVLSNSLKGSAFVTDASVVAGIDISRVRAEELSVEQLAGIHHVLAGGTP